MQNSLTKTVKYPLSNTVMNKLFVRQRIFYSTLKGVNVQKAAGADGITP